MDDEILEQLNKDFTFDFTIPMAHEDSQYLTDGNRVVFKDMDGDFQEFQIYKTEEEHSDSESLIRVYTEHSIYEINDDIVEDLRVANGDITEALDKGLSASRWKRGKVDALGTGTVNFYYSNGMKNLTDIQAEYGGEFKYRVVLNESKTAIKERFVDLLVRRGSDTNKRYEYTKDIRTLKRTIDRSGIKTAIYGRGKGEEIDEGNGYSRKVTIELAQWSKAMGDPMDKPLGQKFLADPEALAQFGRQGRHRFDTFEVDSTDPYVILEATYKALMEVNKPRYTIEVEGQDLEIVGLSHEAVRLGDSVFIIDRTFKPELRVESRIVEVRRSLSNPENIKVVLGNFIPLSTDIAVELEDLKADFTDRKGVWDKVGDIEIEVGDLTDESIKNVIPNVPSGFTATGLFKSIAVEWDFEPSLYIATYEVYGSKVKGFTVDESNLLFRGKTGGYIQKADTNETWYFRIQAVNTHGNKSQLSSEISGSTIRIETADYEDLSIVNAKIANLSVDASKIAKASITDAEIKSLNADKIIAGKIQARFVEIGSTTSYASGYDPSTKATPSDVSSAEARANTHAESIAEAKRKLAEANAIAYADGIVSVEELARIEEAQANLTTAKNHANSVSNQAEANAKGYTDTKTSTILDDAKEYALPSRSLIFDPTFVHGKEFWADSFTGATASELTNGKAIDSTESLVGGKLLSLTGDTGVFSMNPIPVKTDRVYRMTIRLRQTVDPTDVTKNKLYAGVTTLNEKLENISGGAGYHRYCGVAGASLTVADGWQTFTGIITGEGDLHENFRVGTKYVRPMFMVNYSKGDGTVEVDYVDFEDVTEIQELTRIVDEVSLMTTETSIIATVTNSQEYSNDLLSKANAKDLENYATTDALEEAKTDLAGTMDEKIGKIDFTPYATKTEVTTTAEALDTKFSSSGGVNLIKNSVGFAGTDFWNVSLDKDSYGVTLGSIDTQQGGTIDEKGSGSAFIIKGAKLSQDFSISANNLTLSAIVKKPTGVSGYIQVEYDSGLVEKYDLLSTKEYDFEKVQFIISPTGNNFTVTLYGGIQNDLIVTSLMVNVGNVALQWQHSSGEVYNTNVLMDLNGIRVISNQYNGYTSITPEEFSGYAEVDGEMKRVFTLNKEVTEMEKVKVRSEIAMSPIKVVPVQGTYNGWAFIKEET